MSAPLNLPLPESHLAKAQLWARALRRRILDYWYATTEGRDAAQIEAAAAAVVVAVLDEVVFEAAHGASYRKLRDSPRGRVVLGLRLIRNAEIHSHEVAPLAQRAMFGVPDLGFREQLTWPAFNELPAAYRHRATGEHRARGRERDAFRKFVAGRPVVETLFEALAFFEQLDARLVPDRELHLRYSFIPPQPLGVNKERLPSRPMFLDAFQLELPPLAARPWERLRPDQPPRDVELTRLGRRARKELPMSGCREIRGRILDDQRRLIGYRGLGGPRGAHHRSSWAERHSQVARDIARGFRYFAVVDGVEHDAAVRNRQLVFADESLGDGLLTANDSAFWLDHLLVNESAPELYLIERRAAS